ncbi:MAG: hypothetical protein JWP52_596, partial [Rhizobacter sp.]|nr:hypothetical protein [Rhizobacter sp.]
QTRWSPENGGRVYRHDIRALMTYKQEARASVTQWPSWARIDCPVLLIHGMESDALAAPTIARMRRSKPLTVAHVPQTGHTPALADRNQTHAILAWLQDESPVPTEFSIPLAPPRRVWSR